MLPPALSPPTFTRLPAVVLLGSPTSMVLGVAERYDAVIKTIIMVNSSASPVTVTAFIGIGGREGYLTPNPITLAATGDSSSWLVMDCEMRLEEGDYIRAMPSVDSVVTMLVFGDNVFTG